MPSNPSQEREHPRSPMLSLPNYNSYFLLNDSYYSDSCDNDFLAFLYSLSSDISPSLIYFNFFSFWTLYKLNHSIFFCVLLCSHNMMFFTICIVSEAVVLASCLFLKKVLNASHFYCCTVSHCMDVPRFTFLFSCW